MVNHCIVRNCNTGLKNLKLKRSQFQVPKDVELRKKWEAVIPGISVLRKTSRVCERHFNEDDIIREYKTVAENGLTVVVGSYLRPRLRGSAIPSVFEDDKPDYNKFRVQYTDNSVPEINVSQNIKQELTDEETSENHMDIWIDTDLLSEGNSDQDPLYLQATEVKSEPKIISSENVEDSLEGEISRNLQETVYEETSENVQNLVHEEVSEKVQESLDEAKSKIDFNHLGKEISENVQNLVYEEASEKVLKSVDQEKSKIDFNHLTFFNSNIPMPKKWGATKISVENGEYFLFTHSFLINSSDVEYPASCLHVKLDVNKNLKYFLFGRLVDFKRVNLPPLLNSFNDISQILTIFEKKADVVVLEIKII